MSKRYIDADALAEMIRAKGDTMLDGKQIFLYIAKWLEFLPPADVVEVVRCRECKYCLHYVTPTLERYECHYYGCSDEVVDYVEPMHFCSYGERIGE